MHVAVARLLAQVRSASAPYYRAGGLRGSPLMGLGLRPIPQVFPQGAVNYR
jgi:hypothetical protein